MAQGNRARCAGARRGVLAVVVLTATLGCGTTRCTDTSRTATEQLLVSNSIDQAISEIDMTCLAGKKVFFDPQYLDGAVDKGYLVSSLRQHLLASGCLLQDDRTKATHVVEARSGAVGTDRKELLFGVPAINVPSVVPGQPSGPIPEIPLAKHTDRKGVAKIAVFAYNRTTGQPVWQSGVVQTASTAKDTWVFGSGPWEKGSLYGGTKIAGQPVQLPLRGEPADDPEKPTPVIPVTQAAHWKVAPLPPEQTEVAKPAAPPATPAPAAKPREPERFPLQSEAPRPATTEPVIRAATTETPIAKTAP